MTIFLVTRGRFTRGGGETERRAAFEYGVLSIMTKFFNESRIDEESDLT